MQQVKLFHGTEDRIDAVEHEINAWIRASGARILQVTANIAPQTVLDVSESRRVPGAPDASSRRFGASDLLVCVLYDDVK